MPTPSPIPAAPAHEPIPLPGGPISPPIVPPSHATNVSYPSISKSEIEVHQLKYGRYKWWAKDAAEQGAVGTPESRPGKAVGVGSAIWSSRDTLPLDEAMGSLKRSSTARTTRGQGQHDQTMSQNGNNVPANRPIVPPTPTLPLASARSQGGSTIKPTPLPFLARPNPVNPTDRAKSPGSGQLLQPAPVQGSTRAQREAYLSSALSLPLDDMLSEVIDPLPPHMGSRTSSKGRSARDSFNSAKHHGGGDSARLPLRTVSASVTPSDKAISTRSKTVANVPSVQEAKQKALPPSRPQLVRSTKTAHSSQPHPGPTLATSSVLPVLVPPLVLPQPGKILINGALGLSEDYTPSRRQPTVTTQRSPHSVPRPFIAKADEPRYTASHKSDRPMQPPTVSLAPPVQLAVTHQGLTARNLGSQGSQRSRPVQAIPVVSGNVDIHPTEQQTRQLGSGNSQLSHRRPVVPDHLEPPLVHPSAANVEQSHSHIPKPQARQLGSTAPRQSQPHSAGLIDSTVGHDTVQVDPQVRALGSDHSGSLEQPQEIVRNMTSQRSRRSPSPLPPVSSPVDNFLPPPPFNSSIRALGSHGSTGSKGVHDGPVPPPSQRSPAEIRNLGSTSSQHLRPIPHQPSAHAEPPVTHRQHLPLPRPALSRTHSSRDGPQFTLGRRMRDPSVASLTARFEPAMYPLPPSGPSGTETDTVVLSPTAPITPMNNLPLIRSTGASATTNSPTVNLAGNTVVYATNSNVHIGAQDIPVPPPKDRHRSARDPRAARVEEINDDEPLSPRISRSTSNNHLGLRIDTPVSPTNGTSQVDAPVQGYRRPFIQPHDTIDHPTIILPASPPVNVRSPDADHLSFEVPSGHRGRLRVSLAWFRDGSRSGRGDTNRDNRSEVTGSPIPPPVPPKGPASISTRLRETFSPHRAARSMPRAGEQIQQSRVNPPSRRDSPVRRTSPPRRNSPPRVASPPNIASSDRINSPWPYDLAMFAQHPFNVMYPGLGGFAYPQPGVRPGMVGPWPQPGMGMMMGPNGIPMMPNGLNGGPPPHPASRFNPSRAAPAPPSPPRPDSINPPSDRGSPPARPAPLPSQGYGNNMLGMNPSGPMGSRSQHDLQQHADMQRPLWAQAAQDQRQRQNGNGSGMFSRMFGRSRTYDRDQNRDGEDGSKVGIWRRSVIPGRAPTQAPLPHPAPTYAPPPARSVFPPPRQVDLGRNDNRWNENGWSRMFTRRRTDEGYYSGRRREPPMSSGMGLGLTGRQNAYDRLGRGRTGLYADPTAAQRSREKEMRRKAKVERRNRREARSKDSLPSSQNQNQTQTQQGPDRRRGGVPEPSRNRMPGFGGFGGINLMGLARTRRDERGNGGRQRERPGNQGQGVRRAVTPGQSLFAGGLGGLFNGRRGTEGQARSEGVRRKISSRKWTERARETRRRGP